MISRRTIKKILEPENRPILWAFVGIVTLVALAIGVSATKATQDEVTLCHAAGQSGTEKFVTLTISENAAFGQAGHFNENGTPRAGHENDYLGPCETTPTTSEPPVTTEPPTTEPPTTEPPVTTEPPTTTSEPEPEDPDEPDYPPVDEADPADPIERSPSYTG